MKELTHLSISQLNKFQDCPRQHYYQYVLGYEAPATSSQDYGKKCHEFLEQYLKGEISDFPDNYHGRTCSNAKHLLPAPKSGEVEKYFELGISEVPVNVIGYMDYCTTTPVDGRIILLDHKIVKSDMYLLTPERLAATNQIITYSKYLLDTSTADMIEASYLYIKRGGGFAKKVTVELERAQVEEAFKTVADGFRQLSKNYTTTNEDTVPQILSACEKWGGCPFKDKCWGNQQGDTMADFSLLQKLSTLKSTQKPANEAPTDLKPTTPEQRKSLFANMTQAAPQAPIMSASTAPQQAPSILDEIDEGEEPAATVGSLFEAAASSEPAIHVLTSTDSAVLDSDWDDISLSINAPEYDSTPVLSTGGDEHRATAVISSDASPEDIAIVTSTLASEGSSDLAEISQELIQSVVEEDACEPEVQSNQAVEAAAWSWLDADLMGFAELATKTRKALLSSGNTTFRELFIAQPNPTFWGSLHCVKNYGPIAQKEVFGLFEKILGKPFRTYRDFEAVGAPALTNRTERVVETEELQGSLFDQAEPVKEPVKEPVAVAAPVHEAVNEAVNAITGGTQASSSASLEKAPPRGIGRMLLLGSLPMKGLEFNILDDLLEELENTIAASNGQPHISMVNFSKGYDQLAATVKLMLNSSEGGFDWSKPIYASQQAQITYAKVISVLIQAADIILKNA